MKCLILILAALSLPAFAAEEESCTAVDLRPILGPALDQGDTGHCFAHASADLIAVATNHRVSPLDLATSYILANPESAQNSRDPAVMEFLRERPKFLAEWKKDRSEEPELLTPEKILTDEGIYWTGGEEMQTIFLANIFGLCDQRKLPAGEKNYENYLKEINAFHQDRLDNRRYSSRELSDPIGEVSIPRARIAAHSFQNWVNQHCGEHWRPTRPLLPESLRYAKNLKDFEKLLALQNFDLVAIHDRLFEKIDEAMDNHRPVSIGYSANDIMKRSKNYPSGDHASVIAARREIDGNCMYFVRNSFGDNSEDYLARFKRNYEQGGVWVKAKDIKSIYSVVWIRP